MSIWAPHCHSVGLPSGWSVPGEEQWKHYTYIRTNTHIQACMRSHTCTHTEGETGTYTNAAQRRVEQAEAFVQMCDINLVDPKHEAVAPTHSPQCVCVRAKYLS